VGVSAWYNVLYYYQTSREARGGQPNPQRLFFPRPAMTGEVLPTSALRRVYLFL